MGNRETVLEPIRRAYAARDRGDLDGLMAAFHPDAAFTLIGDRKALDVAGSVQGHRGVRETLGGFIATFQFVERHILSELVEGDRAAVHSPIQPDEGNSDDRVPRLVKVSGRKDH